MKKLISKLIILTLFILVISSCKKNNAGSLAGNWDYIYLTSDTTGEKQTWTFDGTSKLEIKIIKPDTTLTYLGTYSYNSRTFSKDEMDIGNVDKFTDGKYKIHKLKDGKLVIERLSFLSGVEDAAFLWKEFVKN